MRKWFTDLGEFLWAVLNHWRELVMGSLLMAGAWYCQGVLGYAIPGKFNLGVAILFLGLGTFGAWRDQKASKEKVQADLQGHLAGQRTAQDVHNFGISYIALYEEGKELKYEVSQSHPVLVFTFEKVVDWQVRVANRLKTEIRPSAFFEFAEIKGTEGGLYDEYNQRAHVCSMLPEQLKFIHRIIDSPSSFMSPQ